MNLWNENFNLGGIDLHEIHELSQSGCLAFDITQSQTLVVDSHRNSRFDMEGTTIDNMKVIVFSQGLAAHGEKQYCSQPVSPILDVPWFRVRNQSLLVIFNKLQNFIQQKWKAKLQRRVD